MSISLSLNRGMKNLQENDHKCQNYARNLNKI